MKLNEVVLLELDQADFLEDARAANTYFEKEMEKIFPKKSAPRGGSRAKYKPGDGATVNIDFKDRSTDGNWKVTIENLDIYLNFNMKLSDSGGKVPKGTEPFVIDGEIHRRMMLDGISYRKVSGKTPMDAMKKLVAWFGKNKAAIKTIEELQKNG